MFGADNLPCGLKIQASELLKYRDFVFFGKATLASETFFFLEKCVNFTPNGAPALVFVPTTLSLCGDFLGLFAPSGHFPKRFMQNWGIPRLPDNHLTISFP